MGEVQTSGRTMKKLSFYIQLVLVLGVIALYGRVNQTTIYNGILKGDLDANFFRILNLSGSTGGSGGGSAGLPSISALRAATVPSTDGTLQYVGGYYSPRDGGGGDF